MLLAVRRKGHAPYTCGCELPKACSLYFWLLVGYVMFIILLAEYARACSLYF